MKISSRFIILSLSLAAAVSLAQDLAPSSIPDAIKAPATDKLAMTVNARGVQIYECRAKKDDPTQFEWALKAPEAELFDAGGKPVGKHYGGPTWESLDGSKVVGEVKGRFDSPDGSIPWLLLVGQENGRHRCVWKSDEHPAHQHGRRQGAVGWMRRRARRLRNPRELQRDVFVLRGEGIAAVSGNCSRPR